MSSRPAGALLGLIALGLLLTACQFINGNQWLTLTPSQPVSNRVLNYSVCAPGDTPPEWSLAAQDWQTALRIIASDVMHPTFNRSSDCLYGTSGGNFPNLVFFAWEGQTVPDEFACPPGAAACMHFDRNPQYLVEHAYIGFTDVFRSMRTSAYPAWARATANHEFGHVMGMADELFTDCDIDPTTGMKTLMGTALGWRTRPPCVVVPQVEPFGVVCVFYDYDCGPISPALSAAASGPDSDGDGWEDAADNCPTNANPLQENRDIDSQGNACDADDDNDAYTDTREAFMGTDPLDNCPDTPQHDAWPPDINRSGKATLTDILMYIPVFNSTAPAPPYSARFDITMDRKIGLADVLSFIPVFNLNCLSTTQSQIIDAVKATEGYRDVNAALADGFNETTQYIPNRGAYFINAARVDTTFDLKQPEGLIYGPGPGGWRLMGVFYLYPVWSSPDPPAGFTGAQDVWSVHNNFCIASDLAASENTSEADCGAAGGVWWAQMGHFLPAWLFRWNQAGVFQELNAAAN